jgi:hypothetical protein
LAAAPLLFWLAPEKRARPTVAHCSRFLACFISGSYNLDMTTVQLRREIKQAVDRLPPKRLDSLAQYVSFLDQTALRKRLVKAEKAIAAGQGVNWRKVRSDV